MMTLGLCPRQLLLSGQKVLINKPILVRLCAMLVAYMFFFTNIENNSLHIIYEKLIVNILPKQQNCAS